MTIFKKGCIHLIFFDLFYFSLETNSVTPQPSTSSILLVVTPSSTETSPTIVRPTQTVILGKLY